MTTKEIRIALLLGIATAFLIPTFSMIHPVKACCSQEADQIYEYYQAPLQNWCGNGDYGKVNLITDISKLFYDNDPNNDWYFYHTHMQTVPGKVACPNSDWRTDNTFAKYTVTNQGTNEWLVNYNPTSTPGTQTSVTVTVGANIGASVATSQGVFTVSWTFTTPDQFITDQSDFSVGRAKWFNDINEQGNVPASVGTYTSEPGFVVRTTEGGQALVSSASDSSSPCNDCSIRVDWGKPGWCGWVCGSWVASWNTGTLYFDAPYTPGQSPSSPTINNIPTLSTNEGQQLSYPAYASDRDGDPVTFSLLQAPAGASITPGGLFTWTPGDHTEGTYWVLVQASDGYGGTATQWFPVNVYEADSAQFISWTPPPATMTRGSQATVSVTMKNTGTSTWQPASSYPPNPFRLGSQNPQDNTNWGLGRVELTQAVPPGGVYTFNFVVTAPQSPGTYNFQWRMVEELIEWFGDYSPSVAVTVPGFTMSSCSGISLQTGGYTGTCPITVSSVGGWSGTVGLSITPGTSGGPTATLSTNSVSVPSGGTGSATVNIVTGSSNGYFYYTLTATSGSMVQSTTFYVYQYTPCNCGGGGSIAHGSLITMADGSQVPVQNLQVGDKMLGYDTTTGTYTVSIIKSLTVVDTPNMLIIHTSAGTPFRVDANPHQTLWVKTASGTIVWVPVTQIKTGDDLFTQNGWVAVTGIDFAPAGTHVMYDIVASTPYFADGYLDPIVKT